jgi:hypothetical protein
MMNIKMLIHLDLQIHNLFFRRPTNAECPSCKADEVTSTGIMIVNYQIYMERGFDFEKRILPEVNYKYFSLLNKR